MVNDLSRGDKRLDRLMTIPGIGWFFAVLIAYDMTEVSRFRTDRKLHSYMGLVPSTGTSDRKVYHGRITHSRLGGCGGRLWSGLAGHPDPIWNSEVESFHRTREDEFYDIEDFANGRAFLDKAATYQLFYNTERKNCWRGNKTALDLIQRLAPNIGAGRVVGPRPITPGALIRYGYHLPTSPIRAETSA